ncbi:MAG TPA: class I SAM-dependent methyltransferase [Thermoplasmata archaeon]|nr:class I SAM-dependent methyltransferase [Thermoplasmata archaeon]
MGGEAHVWDEMYRGGDYLRRWDSREPSPELIALVAAGTIPVKGRTLDIGCGAGRDAVFLAQQGYRSVGVDISAAALEIAAERARQAGVLVDWRPGNALELPLEAASIDFASDRGCFHHIPEALRPRYSAEVARVLRPGRSFLLRGCRLASDEDPSDDPFVAVTEASIDRAFGGKEWSRGPILPLRLVSDAGALDSNVVLLHRK